MVRWALVSLSPGFFALRLNAAVQLALVLESVVAPAVERQAVPAFTLSLKTRVPVANVLPALLVWAVKLANVAAPATDDTAPMTSKLMRRRFAMLTDTS